MNEHVNSIFPKLLCPRTVPDEAPPVDEVLGILRGWQALPKATLLKAFEAGNFAGEGGGCRVGRCVGWCVGVL